MGLTVLAAAALLLALLAGVLAVLATCLKTAGPDEALVVNTPGGRRVSFTSMVVIPVVHGLDRVSLRAHPVRLDRTGGAALRTRDDHAVELVATFHLRVNKVGEDVLRALQTMGPRAGAADAVVDRFAPLLTDALEATARHHDAATIDRDREAFKDAVLERVGGDLDGYFLDDLALTGVRVLPVSPYRG